MLPDADLPDVDLPNGAHLVILHRWRDQYAHYTRYVDHNHCHVTYVCTPLSRPSVPGTAAAAQLVTDLTDAAQVRAALVEPIRRFGRPAAVVALQEADLPVAVALRAEYGAPGRRAEDLTPFLDKHVLADVVARLGIPAPRGRMVRSVDEIAGYAATVGWPLVVKPFSGRASLDVRRLDGPDALDSLPARLDQPMLAQEYVPHPVYHADGYFDGKHLRPWRLARYVNVPRAATNGPLAFTLGEPTGEVEIDDEARLAAAADFLWTVIPRLSADPWVFHLELFMTDSRPYDCLLLEVGCRPGGGEIPFSWRENYGVDLMAIEFALQCGQVPEPPAIPPDAPIAGSLLVPLAASPPCEVLAAPSMVDLDHGPYTEVLPVPGTVIPAVAGTYEYVGGRFRFRGSSTADVERKILKTAQTYRVACRPVAEKVG